MKKFCKKCKQIKYEKSFRKERRTCKKCEKIYMKIWRSKNQLKIKDYTKKYYKKYKNIIDQIYKIYYLNNKKYFSKKAIDYRKKHLNKIKKVRKLYIINNKNKINKYIRNRLKKDINFKLKIYLRTRVRDALKNHIKSKSTGKLIGCSIEKLKKHLESQFKSGMSWSNYGKWHIDHIKPCAKFDLSKPSEQRKCFNYKNLQPLWAGENLKKGSKQ